MALLREKDTASLTLEDLNKIVVKVRPSDTPLDTLTRELNNVTHVKNRETGGFEMGTMMAYPNWPCSLMLV